MENKQYTIPKEYIRELMLRHLETDWGKRCEIKDTDEFDDLVMIGDPDAGRCPICLAYEKFDAFWEYFDRETVSS